MLPLALAILAYGGSPMTQGGKSPPQEAKTAPKDVRAAKLAAQLRANLKRRKGVQPPAKPVQNDGG